MGFRFRTLFSLLIATLLSTGLYARTATHTTKNPKRDRVAESPRAQTRMSHLRHSRKLRNVRLKRRHRYYEHFYTSSFATDLTEGDVVAGEDPVVRQAALDALGDMNGTMVSLVPS